MSHTFVISLTRMYVKESKLNIYRTSENITLIVATPYILAIENIVHISVANLCFNYPFQFLSLYSLRLIQEK